ncbi:hypothetical protein DAPPUDRAFT_98611 [Daphnia pulex]|uniref:Uncharacterized protein n=1 Tax=Daphnia pulex TaxID=6669 RepID=E9G5A0_DAPPU|nr:hypothetical protein DAPPUDRAFT_98611 [Daphnia pulex]|eukprot:EFX85669.1 hypothetical protein DAPPUDRAFT_98611 [Daphnia pulex]
MVIDIQQPFTEGLSHLENLFDMVMNYDDNDGHTTEKPIVYAPIQRAIRWTFDSMSDSELLTQKHLKRYEAKVLALAEDIAAKEKRIVKEKAALESLKIDLSERKKQIKVLREQVSNVETKLRESENKAQRARDEASRRKKNRVGWIFAIIFTIGLASPGYITNEGELQKAERDRDAHQSNANERRQTLAKFESNLRDISFRQRVTEQSIVTTGASLTSVRFVLDKLKSQDPAMRGFGDKIRNITTYLTVCQGKVEVIYSQQKLLVLFEPLLKSIDQLVLFLESNDETTSLLAEKNIVEKIRKYMN